jgi:hypothetical protein
MDWPLSSHVPSYIGLQTGTRVRLPRDVVTETWASPVKCIYQRGLKWTNLHRNFPFMLSGIFMIGIITASPVCSFKPNSISMMIQHRDFTLHSSSKSCVRAARAEIFYSGIIHADLRIQISMFIYDKHKQILLVHLVLFITRCKSAALICLNL